MKKQFLTIILIVTLLLSCNNTQNETNYTNLLNLSMIDGQAVLSGNLDNIHNKKSFLQIASDIAERSNMKEGESISLDFVHERNRSVIDVPPEIHVFFPSCIEKISPHTVTIFNTTWECHRTLWTYSCLTCGEVYHVVSHSVSHF